MPNRSTAITVFAILCVAFLWGYKQEALLAAWQTSDEPDPAPPADSVALDAQPNVPGGPPIAAVNNYPGGGFQPPRSPSSQFPGQFPPGQPPPRPPTLSDNLDSIRPTQVQPEQITQRNAYFEKLSQQLRDLQGGAPPPAGSPPDAAPPPPIEAPPPPYPGSFPPDGGVGAGFPDGHNPMAVPPQADFDQQTVGVEDDEELEEDIEDAPDADSDEEE